MINVPCDNYLKQREQGALILEGKLIVKDSTKEATQGHESMGPPKNGALPIRQWIPGYFRSVRSRLRIS